MATALSPRPDRDDASAPTLSVVVPFYGVEDYLEECLVSLRDQLLQDVEFLLVDDGSPDGCVDIAERFVHEDPRFRLLRQENAGLGPARNLGAQHARGRYITFVDSDDVVAPRGFVAMVDSLEETGSQFAAGNAKRFNRERGSYQSWTHEEPFATTVRRTTLAARPDLIRDRMVWNKLYRRSFWQEGSFAFPPIRYEDYPVTLRAYLEATSVDILSEHVYFWRDRESGTSITQQTADVRNAAERFESARMVMDVLHSHDAPAEVTRRVASYFARVDLGSLMGTAVAAAPEDRDGVEAMARELARIIDPREATEQIESSRLMHRALRDGDLPLARAMARWRTGGSNAQLIREVAATRNPLSLAAVARAVVVAKAPQHPLRPRRLRSTFVDATWHDATLRLTIETRLRGSLARRARLEACVEIAGERHPVAVERVTSQPWGLTADVALAPGGLPSTPQPAVITLSLAVPGTPLRWQGPVAGDPNDLPAPYLATATAFVVTAAPDLAVATLDRADFVMAEVTTRGPLFEFDLPRDVTALRVLRPHPTPDVDVPVDANEAPGARAALDPAIVLPDDVPDDPISGVFEREIMALTPGGPTAVVFTGPPLASALADGRRVEIGRNEDARAVLRRLAD